MGTSLYRGLEQAAVLDSRAAIHHDGEPRLLSAPGGIQVDNAELTPEDASPFRNCLLGNLGQCNYGAAKLGIVALARIVAMENASKGITVNVVCPSADTRMTRSVPTPKDAQAAALREERLRRSRADAIAPLCVFLASQQGSHVNGQVFHQRAGELSLYGHMRPLRMVHRQGGWTPETLAEVAIPALAPQFTPLDSRAVHPGLPME